MKEGQPTLLEESYEEFKNMAIVRWFIRMLDSRYALYVLPIIVLVDVYLLILPLEPILAAYAAKHTQTKLWVITAISSIVSLIGYLSLYYVGFYFSAQTLGFFQSIFGEENISAVSDLLGTSFVLLGEPISVAAIVGLSSALASVPIPLSALTFSIGVFQVPLIGFALMFTVGRSIRYYIAAWIGRRYGVKALEAVFKNIYIFTLLVVMSLVLVLFKVL